MKRDPDAGRDELERSEEGATQNERETKRKQVYLRTVYPLNPGIPHFVDVPGGW